MTISAVSAGEVGEGVTEVLAGSKKDDLVPVGCDNGAAGASFNSPFRFLAILGSGATSLGCETTGMSRLFSFLSSSGGS